MIFITIRPHVFLVWKRKKKEQTMELGKSMENQTDVMVLLAKHVIPTVANGSNLVFSPMSINVLLCLIAAGSNCVTKEQILSFIMLPSSDYLNAVLAKTVSVALNDGMERSDLHLSTAYGVWIDKSLSFKPSFKDLLENSYNATCNQVDFATKVTPLCSSQFLLNFSLPQINY